MRLLLLIPLLLLAVPARAADIIAPSQVEPHNLVDVSTEEAGTGYAWFVLGPRGMERWVPTGPLNQSVTFTGPPGKYTIMLVVLAKTGGLDQGFAVVIIGDAEPPPPPPDPEVTREAVREWLDDVPASAREESITHPITGEKFTRQTAVGRTFMEVGKVAKDLRSVPAANVMLTTGLVAAFGSRASQWRPFAVLADAALAAAEKRGISAADYGKVLAVIGGALQ